MNSRNTASTTTVTTPQTTRVIIPTIPPQGWARFEGKGVAMQLPDTFIGGNIQNYSDQMLESAKKQLPEAVSILEDALQHPEKFAFLAFDRASVNKFATNINVVKGRFSEEQYPLADIQKELIKQFPANFKFLTSDIVKINDIEVIRSVLIIQMQTVTAKELQYIRMDENNDAWITAYTTNTVEFEHRLPTFEQSYQSFELLPQ